MAAIQLSTRMLGDSDKRCVYKHGWSRSLWATKDLGVLLSSCTRPILSCWEEYPGRSRANHTKEGKVNLDTFLRSQVCRGSRCVAHFLNPPCSHVHAVGRYHGDLSNPVEATGRDHAGGTYLRYKIQSCKKIKLQCEQSLNNNERKKTQCKIAKRIFYVKCIVIFYGISLHLNGFAARSQSCLIERSTIRRENVVRMRPRHKEYKQ